MSVTVVLNTYEFRFPRYCPYKRSEHGRQCFECNRQKGCIHYELPNCVMLYLQHKHPTLDILVVPDCFVRFMCDGDDMDVAVEDGYYELHNCAVDEDDIIRDVRDIITMYLAELNGKVADIFR